MKKIVLRLSFVAVVLAVGFCSTYGQNEVNKSLILGHWDMYAFGDALNADSLEQSITAFIEKLQKKDPSRKLTAQDTIAIRKRGEAVHEMVKACYMEFNKDENYVNCLCFDKDKDGKPPVIKGTFKWVANNRITTTDITGTTPYLVEKLSENELILSNAGNEEENFLIRLKFRRGKS